MSALSSHLRKSSLAVPIARRLAVLLALVLLVAILALERNHHPGAAAAATSLYPNLTPFPAFDVQIDFEGQDRILRFSTKSWNHGTGPLELRGGATNPGILTQDVYQRIYADDGSHADVFSGSFTWHPAHSHVHFDRYADYILDQVGAAGAGSGSKTTFCVMDTDSINLGLPGAPPSAVYNTCGATRQGMSVGWADTYGYYLAGQEIDVTGFPAGDYQLTINVDPADNIVESDDTDNSSVVLLRINPSAGTVSVLPDSDTDGVQNSEDNCPSWANTDQSLPDWPVPAGDSDCDGFTNAAETSLGTVSTSHCPSGPSDDAWPPDLSVNGSVSVTDVLFLKTGYGQAVPPAPARHDLGGGASVAITDVLMLKPYFGLSCGN